MNRRLVGFAIGHEITHEVVDGTPRTGIEFAAFLTKTCAHGVGKLVDMTAMRQAITARDGAQKSMEKTRHGNFLLRMRKFYHARALVVNMAAWNKYELKQYSTI